MLDPRTPQWRRVAARAVQGAPAPVRRSFWATRRGLGRAHRRRLEARGDYSLSRPAAEGLDERLAAYLDRDAGFFVEAGAFDGYTQSNTYYLERARGWTGVLVEPVPRLARIARRERRRSRVFNCALVSRDYDAPTMELRYGGTMTLPATEPGADRWAAEAQVNMALDEPMHTFSVPARTLSSVLDEAGAREIDFMSLDVEGYEPQVLDGLDLARHAPRLLLVEVNQRGDRAPIDAALGNRYRELEQLSPFDLLFERVSGSSAG